MVKHTTIFSYIYLWYVFLHLISMYSSQMPFFCFVLGGSDFFHLYILDTSSLFEEQLAKSLPTLWIASCSRSFSDFLRCTKAF